jgi:hypothetical protein
MPINLNLLAIICTEERLHVQKMNILPARYSYQILLKKDQEEVDCYFSFQTFHPKVKAITTYVSKNISIFVRFSRKKKILKPCLIF